MGKRARAALVAPVAVAFIGVVAYFLWQAGMVGEPPTPREPVAIWPLTGEEAPSEAAVRERVVSVKIENLAAARPQTGLSSADVVYESLTEGGITRFNAIFHSELPERVGPVRSARFSDLYIVPQYRALFAYSGANDLVLARIADAGLEDMGANAAGDLYSRSAERAAPHNLYLGLGAVREAAGERGFPVEADPPRLVFGDAPSAEASASAVTVPFRAQNRVTWTWNPAAGAYARAINGEPHVDTKSDGPYAASNVIVLFAEESGGDREGTLDICLVGTGAAVLFRDGLRYDATRSAEADSPPRFTTADGAELPLAVGRTWIEVVPVGMAIETE